MKNGKTAAVILLLMVTACCKEKDISYCQNEINFEISGTAIGTYDDSFSHLLTIALENEICIITRTSIRIFPYNTLNSKFQLDGNFNGAVVNEFDTIIQMDNSFYRFFPTSRQLEHIYTPPFSIHDFCVTPNHGIGYIWGNTFVEPLKFNYYTFSTDQNKTHFEYAKFIRDSLNPYKQYQTYLKEDSLRLFLRTVDVSNTLGGVMYRINLEDTIIKNKLAYAGKSLINVLDFHVTKSDYTFPINWLKSSYFIDGDYLSITLKHSSNPDQTEFVNWRTGVKCFSFVTPYEYLSSFVQIQHYEDKLVLLYNQRRHTAIGFDKNGCKQFELIAENNINSIVFMDDQKIVTLNDQNTVELFKIK